MTPTSRMRAGNGPARRLDDGVDRGQPALAQQLARARGRPGCSARRGPPGPGRPRARPASTIGQRLLGGRGERLLHEHRQAPLDRREGERHVGGGGGRDDDGVDVGLADHRERVGEARRRRSARSPRRAPRDRGRRPRRGWSRGGRRSRAGGSGPSSPGRRGRRAERRRLGSPGHRGGDVADRGHDRRQVLLGAASGGPGSPAPRPRGGPSPAGRGRAAPGT